MRMSQNKKYRRIADMDLYMGQGGERDIKERKNAARREDKESGLKHRIGLAQRKCVQNIHTAETEWKKLNKDLLTSQEKLNEAYDNIFKSIDKAAADSIARIIAEIKQPIVKENSKEPLLEIDLPVDIFYTDFESFCSKELQDIKLDETSFNNIIKKYLSLNLQSLKTYGKNYNYSKPAQKFEENLNYLEKVVVKELTTSV